MRCRTHASFKRFDQCSNGLLVEAHQNNCLRIQRLRETSAALDTQIRDTIASLASTRKDIVTTHTTTYPSGPNYPIAYEELLSYARRISKTTMPPVGTINGVPQTQASSPALDAPASTAITSSAPTPSQPQSPIATNGAARPSDQSRLQQSTGLPSKTQLPEVMDRYMNVFSGQLFFPWPLEDKIRSGSLASNQVLMERGIDPKEFDPAEEEARKRKENEQRREREQREKAEREERERRIVEERDRAIQERELQRKRELAEWRRGSGAGGPAAGGPASNPADAASREKKQFQFTNLDDLDDDDEEA